MEKRWDFSAWYRACLAKNWPTVQEANEVNEVKEVKENAPNLQLGGGLRDTKTQRAKILE